MPASELRLVKRCAEWEPRSNIHLVPSGTRGIYVLLKADEKTHYDVRYVGMSRAGFGIRRRLEAHTKSKRKGKEWSHFSIYEFWDNITEREIQEIEGLFLHCFRKDSTAVALVRQRRLKSLLNVRK